MLPCRGMVAALERGALAASSLVLGVILAFARPWPSRIERGPGAGPGDFVARNPVGPENSVVASRPGEIGFLGCCEVYPCRSCGVRVKGCNPPLRHLSHKPWSERFGSRGVGCRTRPLEMRQGCDLGFCGSGGCGGCCPTSFSALDIIPGQRPGICRGVAVASVLLMPGTHGSQLKCCR